MRKRYFGLEVCGMETLSCSFEDICSVNALSALVLYLDHDNYPQPEARQFVSMQRLVSFWTIQCPITVSLGITINSERITDLKLVEKKKDFLKANSSFLKSVEIQSTINNGLCPTSHGEAGTQGSDEVKLCKCSCTCRD